MSLTTTIIVIVVAAVILVIINLANKTAPKCIDKTHFTNEWNDIVEMSKNPKSRLMSVIKADKLLDQALKGCGYKGETMAKRLVAAKHQIKDKNAVWQAHKLRNRIAHESLFEPDDKEINTALNGYRKAFKDLGAI